MAMRDTIGERVVLTWSGGLRAVYEPETDRCWIEMPPDYTGIMLTAVADNAAILYEGVTFLPDWWVLQEQPDLADVLEGIKERGRKEA